MISTARYRLTRRASIALGAMGAAIVLASCEVLYPTGNFLSPESASDAGALPSDGTAPRDSPGSDATSTIDAPTSETGSDASCEASMTDPHNCGGCGRDCRGGACDDGGCSPVLLGTSGAGLPGFVTVDSNRVYWAQYSSSASPVGVSSCPKGGCGEAGPSTVVAEDNVIGVAVSDPYVYWTYNAGNGAVCRCALDAAPCSTSNLEIVASSDEPQGIAAAGALIAWTTRPPGSGPEYDGGVFTCEVADCGSPAPLFVDRGYGLEGIALQGGSLYWAADDGTVRTCLLPGCSSPVVLGTAGTIESVGGLAVDDASVYWSSYGGDGGGGIFVCPLSGCAEGGSPGVLLAGTAVFGVARDSRALYWTGFADDAGTVVGLWVWVR